jgi:hypothetical protein
MQSKKTPTEGSGIEHICALVFIFLSLIFLPDAFVPDALQNKTERFEKAMRLLQLVFPGVLITVSHGIHLQFAVVEKPNVLLVL